MLLTNKSKFFTGVPGRTSFTVGLQQVLQQKGDRTLQQRVSDYLRDTPKKYVVEETEDDTAEAMFKLLSEAQGQLRAAQERVDRLRAELAKIQAN